MPSLRLAAGRSFFPLTHHKVIGNLKKSDNASTLEENLSLSLSTSVYSDELM